MDFVAYLSARQLVFLADTVLVVHVVFVVYVVGGAAAILYGACRMRPWVRNRWFRYSHVASIGIVAVQAALGVPCFLTIWERDLRLAAGQSVSQLPFIPRMLQHLIFFDAPLWWFTILYLVFGGAVITALVLIPPRNDHSSKGARADHDDT